MTMVLSRSPRSRRKSSSRPRWWSVWLRKPANTSMKRLNNLRAGSGCESQSGTSGSCRESSASAGTMPSSFCRVKTFSRRDQRGRLGRPGRRLVRPEFADARRVVVKVGSSSLTTLPGGLDVERLTALVDVLGALRAAGREVVLVSSGAIAAGLAPLGIAGRPKDLATAQAAASVGQLRLVQTYAEAFAGHGVTVGQVLLTADDLTRRSHYRNAQQTVDRLLALGALPIVNENDTVATEEIRFGDNDRLAALVAHVARADALVLLSDVDGLYDGDPRSGPAELIDTVTGPGDLASVTLGSAKRNGVGTGGMATKV